MQHKRYISLLMFVFCLSASIADALSVHTLYGTYTVTEPIIKDLLKTTALKRLRAIHQYGVQQYVCKTLQPYTRYDHSVGVMVLLRRFGAPLQEQVAGLLHDVSHTVFSHVGDHLMMPKTCQFDQNHVAYQDNVHVRCLAQTDISAVLHMYGIDLDEMDHKKGTYPMLEQELPDVCADRLEYNLYGGYIEGLITQQEVQDILASLRYGCNRWYFEDQHHARALADLSLWLTEHQFASSWNFVIYEFAARALKRALELGMIHDVHTAHDDDTWHLLLGSSDPTIKTNVMGIMHYQDRYQEVAEGEPYDACFIGKLRVVDPWVRVHRRFQRLSELDDSFKQEMERVKAAVTKTRYIRYTSDQ